MRVSILYGLKNSPGRSSRIELFRDEERWFGRAAKDLFMDDDPTFSRMHFKIRFDGEEIVVTHLSKVNPTHVEVDDQKRFTAIQKPKHCVRATTKCLIKAGDYRFRVVIESDESTISNSEEQYSTEIAECESWDTQNANSNESAEFETRFDDSEIRDCQPHYYENDRGNSIQPTIQFPPLDD